jgi:superfamily II DNA or RNA helicase
MTVKLDIRNNLTFIDRANDEEIRAIAKVLTVKFYDKSGNNRGQVLKTVNLFDRRVGKIGAFPTGYLTRLADKLPDIQFEANDNRVSKSCEKFNYRNKSDYEDRKWQKEAKEVIAEEHLGCIVAPMGSGKSEVIADTVAKKKGRTLVLTPFESVRDQLAKSIEEKIGKKYVSKKLPNMSSRYHNSGIKTYDIDGEEIDENNTPESRVLSKKGYIASRSGWKKNYLKGTEEDKTKKFPAVTVICFHSLHMASPEFLNSIDVVIIDEFHTASSDSIRIPLAKMENAYFRYFFSATPDREQWEDKELLYASSGLDIIYEYNVNDAVEDKVMAAVEVESVDSPQPKDWIDSKWDYRQAYDLGIVCNGERNQHFVDLAIRSMHDNNVLIFTDETEHMDLIVERLLESGVSPYAINGKMEKRKKESTIDSVGKIEKGVITVGTNAIGVGVDLPLVSMIILLGGGKSFNKIIQQSGRGTRFVEGVSEECIVITPFDWFHPKLLDHSIKRKVRLESYFNKKEE